MFFIICFIIFGGFLFTSDVSGVDCSNAFHNSELITINFGRSNCLFYRKQNEIVIVDAGAANGMNVKLDDPRFEYVKCLFKDCTLTGVVITHLHKDHYSLIGSIMKMYREYKQNKVNIVIGSNVENTRLSNVLSLLDPNNRNVNISIYDCIRGKTYDKDCVEIDTDINKLISLNGQYGFFYKPITIRESIFFDHNVYSLIFYLDGIIYTGDANKTTIGNDIAIPSIRKARSQNMMRFVKSIDRKKVIVVAPHHGSRTKGSRALRNALRNELKCKCQFKGFLVPNTMNDKIASFYESTLLEEPYIKYLINDNCDINIFQNVEYEPSYILPSLLGK